MKALRDAGIALIVIVLAISVRISPLEQAEAPGEPGALSPRAQAASSTAAGPAPVLPARRPAKSPAPQWISTGRPAPATRVDLETIEYCTEVLLDLRDAAAQSRVVTVLPCSA